MTPGVIKRSLNMRKRSIISILLAAAVVLSLCGCTRETAEDIDETFENNIQTYESDDGWKMTYDTDYIAVNKVEGKVIFSYTGDASGTNEVAIFYMPTKQPQDALYDLTQEYEDSVITREEGYIGYSWEDWSFYALISPVKEGSKENKIITAAEHNGGSLILDSTFVIEDDEEKGMDISDRMSAMLDTFEFTNHEPQTQFSYVPGKYKNAYTEEIEGEEQTVIDEVVLNTDHTGTLAFQDNIDICWTSYELVETESGNRYEYSIEGDYLYVNLNGDEWMEFVRE